MGKDLRGKELGRGISQREELTLGQQKEFCRGR